MVVEEFASRSGGNASPDIAALAHVANRPIAHHVFDALAEAGVGEIVVASSSQLSRDVRECLDARGSAEGIRLQYVHESRPLDLARALTLAAPLVGDAPCIVHSASGLLGEPLQPFLHQLRQDAPDTVLFVHQGPAPYAVLTAGSRRMLRVAELDPRRDALGAAGVLMFGPGALKRAAETCWWNGRQVDLTAISDRIAAAGGSLHVRLATLWHGYSGSAPDLLDLNRAILDRMDTAGRRQDNNGNRIEGRVLIHEGASVHTSVIVGPVLIGPGARISDAYIGPYTAVGAGAHVEGAEIERSIISAGATIMHIGCRLAGSVIGRDARVFRDFSVPRGMRLRVGDGTEVALS